LLGLNLKYCLIPNTLKWEHQQCTAEIGLYN
jgi:hypothetical protein